MHNIERHNERKNKSYENTDIQLERASKNIYFKQADTGYLETFDHMCETGMISTKGLRDERNEEVSARLGRDVYHYHLHVMYIPIVQKEVKWSKRCKDKALVGTVKEVIT